MAVNSMDYSGKDTVLDVIRAERARFYTIIDDPNNWNTQTRCEEWEVRDIVGHMIDVTEGYLARWELARTLAAGGRTRSWRCARRHRREALHREPHGASVRGSRLLRPQELLPYRAERLPCPGIRRPLVLPRRRQPRQSSPPCCLATNPPDPSRRHRSRRTPSRGRVFRPAPSQSQRCKAPPQS